VRNALVDAEGGPSGSTLAFVNYIAEKIEPESPQVAADTFACQCTRKPPGAPAFPSIQQFRWLAAALCLPFSPAETADLK
jgi:hypothetical protein